MLKAGIPIMSNDDIEKNAKVLEYVEKSSPNEIKLCARRLEKMWRRGKWVDSKNPYKNNPKIDKSIPVESQGYIIEYITASILHHCFDGWSYLGRAIEAELAGDSNAMRHLGYYAELRGVMSILAYEGIGVFAGRHIIVCDENKCEVLSGVGTTHEFILRALDSLKYLDRPHILLRAVNLYNHSLDEWLSVFSGHTRNLVTAELLNKWSVDIKNLLELDHEARKIASYRPSAFELTNLQPIRGMLDFLKILWELLEPSSDGQFRLLDQQLLQLNIEKAFRARYSKMNRKRYLNLANKMICGMSIQDSAKDILSDALHNKSPQYHVIENALREPKVSHASYTHGLLTRAALILRTATGCVELLLRELDTEPKDTLMFWWSSSNVRRRLWSENDRFDDFGTLWFDIDAAWDEIEGWLDSYAGSICHHNVWKMQAPALSTLSTTERICLLGIGL